MALKIICTYVVMYMYIAIQVLVLNYTVPMMLDGVINLCGLEIIHALLPP